MMVVCVMVVCVMVVCVMGLYKKIMYVRAV